jgi:hypothetical protein
VTKQASGPFDVKLEPQPGDSRQHNRIAFNLTRILYPQFRGRSSEAFVGDMRIRVDATGLYTCPDRVVVCGEPRFADAEVDTLLNPTVIFEILSRSTEAYDRARSSRTTDRSNRSPRSSSSRRERVEGGAVRAAAPGEVAASDGEPAGRQAHAGAAGAQVGVASGDGVNPRRPHSLPRRRCQGRPRG